MEDPRALTDFVKFKDTGCKAGGPSCLECPLPLCVEEPEVSQQWMGLTPSERLHRDYDIFELRKKGVPARDIAKRYKLELRTIHRIIQRGGPSERTRELAYEHEDNVSATLKTVHQLKNFYKQRKPWPEMRPAR